MSNKIPIELSPPKVPFPFGLRYAARFVPYGLRGFMQLAWMSDNLEAKKVGSFWLGSDKPTQDSLDLEALCERCHIMPAALISAVVGVACELRVDASPLIAGISRMPDLLSASLTQAISTGEQLEEAVAAIEYMDREMKRR